MLELREGSFNEEDMAIASDAAEKCEWVERTSRVQVCLTFKIAGLQREKE